MGVKEIVCLLQMAASLPGGNVSDPGMAMAVVQNGEPVYTNFCGLSDLNEKTQIDEHTRFCLASCSKQFTAVAILQLRDRGVLSLDDEIRKWFPEYTNSVWEGVTIRHFLSHSSGLPHDRSYLPREKRIFADDELAVEFFQKIDNALFPSGTAYDYSNPTFTLLGKLIERASGMEFEEYMHRYIFSPAEMNETAYFNPKSRMDDESHGYEQVDGKWIECDYGEETFYATRPDGALYTCLQDAMVWMPALLGGKILSINSLREAWTSFVQVGGSPWCNYNNRSGTSYGLGWFIDECGSSTMIYHTGENGGYSTFMAHFPSDNIQIIVLSNRSDWDKEGLIQGLRSCKTDADCANFFSVL